MGHKKILPAFYHFNGTTVTGTTVYTSPLATTTGSTATNASYVGNYDVLLVQVSWTGTPTGTLSYQVSNDGSQWDALSISPAPTQPAGSAGQVAVNIALTGAQFFRIQYTNASGSGTLTASVSGKDLN